jgi:hypothetical protein
MKKKIVWEKWIDPLNNNLEEVEWPGFDLDEEGEEQPMQSISPTKVMQTPFGFLSMMDHNYMTNSFDFWMMYTNFDITPPIAESINEIPGVETLEVYTRYRMRIGFPKSGLFDPSKVKESIANFIAVIDTTPIKDMLLQGVSKEIAAKILVLREGLEEKYKHWAILVLPNGNTEVVASDNEDEVFKEQKDLLLVTRNAISGCLIDSNGDIQPWRAQ